MTVPAIRSTLSLVYLPMGAIDTFDLVSLGNTLISLFAAFVLGGVIGFERQYRQRTAGLRTNVLVAVGAALFVDIAVRMHGLYGGTPGALHVVAYVVSGVGFLGAGVIMREEGSVRGINTAATLWGSAAVGAAAGADLIVEAMVGACFVLSANTLLRPMVNAINRKPLDTVASEVTYSVKLIAPRVHQKEALELLEDVLEAANYPVAELDIELFGEKDVEISAVLMATSVDARELDKAVETLLGAQFVSQAYWSPSAGD
jgi:putative Mg2+ transporter-C (MgtC) family protein